VRLGKGSRGSLFVFERSALADAAAMERVGAERTTPAGVALLLGVLGAMAFGGWSLFKTGVPALQVAGVGLWLVTIGLALVVRQGGIVEDDDEGAAAQRQKAAAAAAVAAAAALQQQQQQQDGSGGLRSAPSAA